MDTRNWPGDRAKMEWAEEVAFWRKTEKRGPKKPRRKGAEQRAQAKKALKKIVRAQKALAKVAAEIVAFYDK